MNIKCELPTPEGMSFFYSHALRHFSTYPRVRYTLSNMKKIINANRHYMHFLKFAICKYNLNAYFQLKNFHLS